LLLEDVWLGGKESPQYGFPNMGDVFESPSKILKESDLKSKDVQYCVRQEKNVRSRSILPSTVDIKM
jgi:hypothetical protein